MPTKAVELWNRLRGLFRREDEAAELAEELRFHREMLERDAQRAGLVGADAHYAARRQLGNATYFNEESRNMWRFQSVETIAQDLRYALRFLRRSPAFTLVAVLSLALGIGANTAIFTLLDTVTLRALPVKDPSQLVLLEPARGENVQQVFPHLYFRTLEEKNTVLDGIFATSKASASMERGNGIEPLANGATVVSGGYFTTLGLRPAVGRLILPSDDITPGAHPVVVLSHELWRTSFGSDSTVVGRQLRINGAPLTVVGVAPRGFFGTQVGEKSDIYMPLMMSNVAFRAPDAIMLTERGDWWLFVMGRLKPGVTKERAAAELSTIFKQDLLANPPFSRANVKGMADLQRASIQLSEASNGLANLRRRFAKPLYVLAGMAVVVLLIACTNLASLLSARATAREREIAVRLSMGAGRRRLVRQLLTESLLLAGAGSILGIGLAWLGARALLAAATRGRTPIALDVTPDLRILGFTLVITVLTAILFGLVPARQATKLQLAHTLRAGGAAGRGRGTIRLGKMLIASQVALSVLLVFGGSLFVRSLQRMYATDVGFNPKDVVVFRMDPRRVGYRGSALRAIYDEIGTRAKALPGVREATFSSHTPFTGSQSGFPGRVEGYVPPPDERADITRVVVGDDYFRVMGIQLRRGQLPSRHEWGNGSGPRVVAVNESFVRAYVPSGQPLGKQVYRGNDSVGATIVAVVADVKFNNFREPTPPIAYWQYAADSSFAGPGQSLLIRIDPTIPGVVGSVTSMVASIDKNIEVLSIRPLAATIDATIANERLVAALAGFFGVFALILAMIGLYGLMAYSVASRVRELGIRIALGAEGKRIARSILGEALVLVIIGIAIGAPVAMAASKVGRALLYGLEPADTGSLLITIAMLGVIAIAASMIPAWRASRVDPVGMLRSE